MLRRKASMQQSWKINLPVNAVEGEELDPAVSIAEEVLVERVNQLRKWGPQNYRQLGEWVLIAGEEYGEVCRAIYELNELGYNDPEGHAVKEYPKLLKAIRSEYVQLAAVVVAAIEAFDSQLR